MTEREKIVKIIRNMDSQSDTLDAITLGDIMRIADALIAAGIGDVSEYKEKLKLHRVFVRKDGGDIKVLYGNNEVDEIVKERNEYKHRAEVAERALKNALNNDTCYFCNEKISCKCEHRDWGSDECIKSLLQQAEKELAEEK